MTAKIFGWIKPFLIICLCGFSCTFLFAASFRTLGIKDGLSSRQVFQINKDSAGFVWIYTHVGMDRYDGNEVRHYTLGEPIDSKKFIHSSTAMVRDREGRIWVSLRHGKVYAYDYASDSFRLRLDLEEVMEEPLLYNILFDDAGALWLCTGNGLYRWTEKEGLSPAALQGQWTNCIAPWGKEGFLVGTNKGLFRLSGGASAGSWQSTAISLPVETQVKTLFYADGKWFIGTFSEGVFVMDGATGQIRSLHHFIPSVSVRAFAGLDEERLLVGTDGAGIFCIDVRNEKLLTRFFADADKDGSLSDNTVTDMCVDERGTLWVSTSTNGVCYLDAEAPDIQWIQHERGNSNSLKSDHVNAVLQDADGDCWYGTNDGVSLYQPATGKWTHFLGNNGRGTRVVLALAEDGKGGCWAGGYGIGLFRIDKKSGKVQRVGHREGTSGRGIATDYIYTIRVVDDDVWLGGIEGDLTCYHIQTDTYSYYPIRCVGDIRAAKGDTLLLAGCDGLAFFDRKSGTASWQHRFGGITLHCPVRCLLLAASGEIWMATDGDGLVRFHPETGAARAYTMADGLASNSVNSLLEDNDGRIWFNTEEELYCMELPSERLICASDFLDITWASYTANAAYRLADGCLAFGTADGVLALSPDLDFNRHEDATLILTDFIRHNRNTFTIGFSSINFTNPHRIRYEYRLKGYEKEWHHAGQVQPVEYADLPPGKYLFQLRAFDKYAGVQIGERTREVRVNAPNWRSWWALLIYLVLLSVLLYLLVQYVRHKAYESRIKEKINSFISIAHDIKTPVTLIKAPLSELESQEGLPEESRKCVEVAARNVGKLLGMITQLLDLQKAELQAEKRLKVAPYDIEAYLKEKMEEFRLAAMQKGVAMTLEVDPGMPQVWIDRSKMDRIVDNLLSNALKYTEQGNVRVTVKGSSKRWTLEIGDTGIGIPKEEQKHIFQQYYRAQNAANYGETGSGIGLMVTRRIVRQHHGTISFYSEEGKGTTFFLSFPRKVKNSLVSEVKKDLQETLPVHAGTEQPEEAADKNVLLLAEDDADMREYLVNSLSAEYKVVSVTDGGKALEMAREINPDLIISDVIMPVLEGDELCRILKSSVETSHIPIILLTALSERENIIFGLEAGASDYIIKPFDLAVLKVRIRNILQNRQHLREAMLSIDQKPEETDYTSQLDKEFMDRVMEVIEQELGNAELSINDFCQLLCMSRTSVFNKMKTLTGQGPNDFIRIVRLNKSKELLLTRRYTVSEVANMVGFADPKYFSTCFKKQFGTSPSKI